MASDNSVYKKFLNAVEDDLSELDLGYPVVQAQLPDDGEFQHQGLVLSWDDEKAEGGTNERDDIAYPAVLSLVKGSVRDWEGEMDEIAYVRERVRRKFHNKRVTLSDSLAIPMGCKVRYGPIGLAEKWVDNWNDSRLVIWGYFRESR